MGETCSYLSTKEFERISCRRFVYSGGVQGASNRPEAPLFLLASVRRDEACFLGPAG